MATEFVSIKNKNTNEVFTAIQLNDGGYRLYSLIVDDGSGDFNITKEDLNDYEIIYDPKSNNNN